HCHRARRREKSFPTRRVLSRQSGVLVEVWSSAADDGATAGRIHPFFERTAGRVGSATGTVRPYPREFSPGRERSTRLAQGARERAGVRSSGGTCFLPARRCFVRGRGRRLLLGRGH